MSLEAVHLGLANAKIFKTAPIKHPPTTPKEYSINEAADIIRKTKILAKKRKVLLGGGMNHLKFIEPKIATT
jgi:hypothetical protein